ncbi:hypothetical protein [Azospirillum sp. sgz301742]
MVPPRFTGEISAGHISIIVTLMTGLGGLYASVTGTLSNHEYRLVQIERTQAEDKRERLQFQGEIRTIAQAIREDVATVKADLKHLGERRP